LVLVVIGKTRGGLGDLVFSIGLREGCFFLNLAKGEFVTCTLDLDFLGQGGGLSPGLIELARGNDLQFSNLAHGLGAQRFGFSLCAGAKLG
jgi:hypothetical protein